MTEQEIRERAAEIQTLVAVGVQHGANPEDERRRIAQILRQVAKESAPAWIPVSERLPEAEHFVIAAYRNELGKWRRVRAFWVPAKTLIADDDDFGEFGDYDEEQDQYFCPEGWYEMNEHDEVAWKISDGTVTHWQPLPLPPGDSSK